MTFEEVINYANQMLYKYNLNDWVIFINDNRTKFGLCYYQHKRIEISMYHIKLNTEKEIKRTILHEIAHALTPKCGHSYTWKMKFQSLLNLELNSFESIKNRFGLGSLPTVAEKKNFNKFDIEITFKK